MLEWKRVQFFDSQCSIMWLCESEIYLRTRLLVSTRYTNVTDGQTSHGTNVTDGQTSHGTRTWQTDRHRTVHERDRRTDISRYTNVTNGQTSHGTRTWQTDRHRTVHERDRRTDIARYTNVTDGHTSHGTRTWQTDRHRTVHERDRRTDIARYTNVTDGQTSHGTRTWQTDRHRTAAKAHYAQCRAAKIDVALFDSLCLLKKPSLFVQNLAFAEKIRKQVYRRRYESRRSSQPKLH